MDGPRLSLAWLPSVAELFALDAPSLPPAAGPKALGAGRKDENPPRLDLVSGAAEVEVSSESLSSLLP